MKKLTILFCILGLIAGCFPTVPPTNPRFVPMDRIHNESFFTSNGHDIMVRVTRDIGTLVGVRAEITFKIDGEPIANFMPGETITIYLNPGDYLLGVVWDVNMSWKSLKEIHVNIKKKSNFRIGIFHGGDTTEPDIRWSSQ